MQHRQITIEVAYKPRGSGFIFLDKEYRFAEKLRYADGRPLQIDGDSDFYVPVVVYDREADELAQDFNHQYPVLPSTLFTGKQAGDVIQFVMGDTCYTATLAVERRIRQPYSIAQVLARLQTTFTPSMYVYNRDIDRAEETTSKPDWLYPRLSFNGYQLLIRGPITVGNLGDDIEREVNVDEVQTVLSAFNRNNGFSIFQRQQANDTFMIAMPGVGNHNIAEVHYLKYENLILFYRKWVDDLKTQRNNFVMLDLHEFDFFNNFNMREKGLSDPYAESGMMFFRVGRGWDLQQSNIRQGDKYALNLLEECGAEPTSFTELYEATITKHKFHATKTDILRAHLLAGVATNESSVPAQEARELLEFVYQQKGTAHYERFLQANRNANNTRGRFIAAHAGIYNELAAAYRPAQRLAVLVDVLQWGELSCLATIVQYEIQLPNPRQFQLDPLATAICLQAVLRNPNVKSACDRRSWTWRNAVEEQLQHVVAEIAKLKGADFSDFVSEASFQDYAVSTEQDNALITPNLANYFIMMNAAQPMPAQARTISPIPQPKREPSKDDKALVDKVSEFAQLNPIQAKRQHQQAFDALKRHPINTFQTLTMQGTGVIEWVYNNLGTGKVCIAGDVCKHMLLLGVPTYVSDTALQGGRINLSVTNSLWREFDRWPESPLYERLVETHKVATNTRGFFICGSEKLCLKVWPGYSQTERLAMIYDVIRFASLHKGNYWRTIEKAEKSLPESERVSLSAATTKELLTALMQNGARQSYVTDYRQTRSNDWSWQQVVTGLMKFPGADFSSFFEFSYLRSNFKLAVVEQIFYEKLVPFIREQEKVIAQEQQITPTHTQAP